MPIKLIYDNTCTSTTPVTCNWTVPDNTYSVLFEIWGGGGGGGAGIANCDCCTKTGSGSGGGYAAKTVATTPGTVYAITAGNGGVASSGYGAPVSTCCNGCPGGTSFVTGTGVPVNFCATGGGGGCSNSTTNCYASCGCQYNTFGQGYNGDVNMPGAPSVRFSDGSSAWSSHTIGGAAGGPGGGQGGRNLGAYGSNNPYGDAANNPNLHGQIPGGGGAGHGCSSCCNCCNGNSGRGAPGLVKITW